MSISTDDVRWIAHLGRLQLTDVEVQTMTRDLVAILEYVKQLEQVDTAGVEPLAHPLDVHNIFRAEELAPCLPVDLALANAPDRKGDYYGVPAVLG